MESAYGKVLQQALAELTKLPEAEQDAVGAWILAELESERRWDDRFARSPDLLAEMAAEAIREGEAGLTEPLDASKPSPPTACPSEPLASQPSFQAVGGDYRAVGIMREPAQFCGVG